MDGRQEARKVTPKHGPASHCQRHCAMRSWQPSETFDGVEMVAMLSSELVRSALESSPDAMVIIDASGTILFANQRLSALFGYEREEVRGSSIEQLMPERFRATHVFAAENRMRPMGAALDLYAQRKDGSEFPVEISLSPVRDGDALVAAAIRDVTERKRVQQELILAREAAEHAREIADEAREAADRANQAKSRFLAMASHDLRQPLQSLALLNGTLRRLVTHPDAVEALTYQDQAIEAMSRLLNALLDISNLESGAIEPAPHVLLVEDDPAVRDATRMLLKVAGYRVLTAASLAEAQACAAEHPQIALLVTDYHLSNGETGRQVIASLRDVLGTSLGAVLITGDTSSAVKDLQHDERLRLARKPINAEELLAILKSLLAN
jgi:PAS domain S-box-containing protein